jgi:hypothetical protein
MNEVWCCGCQTWKQPEDFPPNVRMRNGLASHCRACNSRAAKRWREKNRDYVQQRNAERRAEYREAHPLPTRPCAVCEKPFTGRPDALVCSKDCRRERKRQQREAKAA